MTDYNRYSTVVHTLKCPLGVISLETSSKYTRIEEVVCYITKNWSEK